MNILTKSNATEIKPFDPQNSNNVIGKTFNDACLITVCAWCYPKTEQVKLVTWGFTLSHGICDDCKNHFNLVNKQ